MIIPATTRLGSDDLHRLETKAREIRREIVTMVYRANSGHIGGSLSSADIIVALYYHIMRHYPTNQHWPERDRFIMSKGHCTPVIYAVLADCGYFPREDLATFRRPGSHLQGHPCAHKTPGIEASTGTLGIGISTAMGMALAAKLHGQRHFYYVLCGDGEIQEGQVWEAAMFANKYHLDNVIAFVDRNRLQTDGDSERVMPLDPLPEKWRAFGWETCEIGGHNFQDIIGAVEQAKQQRGKPTMVIANTIKGKGVPFMERDNVWHGSPPTLDQYERAIQELEIAR